MGNIAKIQKGTKRKAVAATPQIPITPTLKQSPRLRKADKYPSFPLKLGRKERVCYPRHLKRKSLLRLPTRPLKRQLKNLHKN